MDSLTSLIIIGKYFRLNLFMTLISYIEIIQNQVD